MNDVKWAQVLVFCTGCTGRSRISHWGQCFWSLVRDEDHKPDTDETMKRAITEGVEPNGEPLAWPMPR